MFVSYEKLSIVCLTFLLESCWGLLQVTCEFCFLNLYEKVFTELLPPFIKIKTWAEKEYVLEKAEWARCGHLQHEINEWVVHELFLIVLFFFIIEPIVIL